MRAQTTSIDWATHLSQIEFDPQLSVRVEHDATISLERLRDVVQGRVLCLEASHSWRGQMRAASVTTDTVAGGGVSCAGSAFETTICLYLRADALPLLPCQGA